LAIEATFCVARELADSVHSWLSNSLPDSLENTDDQGGWPDEDDLTAAFEALGYQWVA